MVGNQVQVEEDNKKGSAAKTTMAAMKTTNIATGTTYYCSHLISNWPLLYLWSLLSPSRWSIIQKSVWSISSSSAWGLAIIRWRCVFSHRGSVHTSSLHKIFCKSTIGNSYLETPYHPGRDNQTHLFLLWSLKITFLTQNHHQWRREGASQSCGWRGVPRLSSSGPY